ncbi:acyl-CoA dehydrogenase family protein [Kitasatospora brasiliensis]|uniref:acyl-CoA dehydrogenase family protein n=1 Tax=Kitasatospora brasiliensis TaxID=3058040 RepID=UPI00292E050C|nr:acyl-CoA dehydrogenase family protein [Kitasatospora sp. K002]
MDVTLAPDQLAVGRRFAELLDDELAPLIRRMADRAGPPAPQSGPDDADGEDNASVRVMIWEALTALGAVRLGHEPESQAHQQVAVLAEQLGRVLYQGPLLDTLVATRAVLRSSIADGPFLEDMRAGTAVAAAIRSGTTRPDNEPIEVDLARGTVTAERRFVGFAAEAEHLLITGTTAAGERRTALVPLAQPSVGLRLQEELGRGEMYAVRLSQAQVATWLDFGDDPESAWDEILASARIFQAAYLVGLSEGALRLGVRHVTTRRQFGAPLAHRQAPAFLLAGLATRIDAARLLTRAAAWEADQGADCRLAAAQALSMASTLAREATRDVMQLHGARGMTQACDAQLFYRRAAVEAVTLGTPVRLRAEVLPLLTRSRLPDRPAGDLVRS